MTFYRVSRKYTSPDVEESVTYMPSRDSRLIFWYGFRIFSEMTEALRKEGGVDIF